jgi:hypothetical protein
MPRIDVLQIVLGFFLVWSVVGGSRQLEPLLQRNGVSEPVARNVKYAGYVLAALFALLFLAYAVSLIVD